jgi:tRNA G10  N-methylase Trm11
MMEEAGIATVVIGSGMYEERLRAMNLPRTVITQYPLGRPLGAPGNARIQREILMAALDMLENAQAPGGVLVLPVDHGE